MTNPTPSGQKPFAGAKCVLDASVGIKLFIEEEFSDKVQRLFSKLADDPQTEIYVPDLFYIECANILLKYPPL